MDFDWRGEMKGTNDGPSWLGDSKPATQMDPVFFIQSVSLDERKN